MADCERAEKAALEIWEQWGWCSPPIPILEVVESYGLSVREVDLSKYQGLSGALDPSKEMIYLHTGDSPTHKRFSIAHELGHWLLHRKEIENENSKYTLLFRRPIGGEQDELEKEANCFAANLLVPLHYLRAYRNRLSHTDLAELFAVSQEVIGYRLNL